MVKNRSVQRESEYFSPSSSSLSTEDANRRITQFFLQKEREEKGREQKRREDKTFSFPSFDSSFSGTFASSSFRLTLPTWPFWFSIKDYSSDCKIKHHLTRGKIETPERTGLYDWLFLVNNKRFCSWEEKIWRIIVELFGLNSFFKKCPDQLLASNCIYYSSLIALHDKSSPFL